MELKAANHLSNFRFSQGDALLVVDIQNDFLPGGALATEEGDGIIEGVNDTMHLCYERGLPVIFTQDWHPEGHHSFASAYPDKAPFDPFEAKGLGPVLWPDHCVQGSRGAEFAGSLYTEYAQTIVRKGYNKRIDSYSGLLENDHETETGLDGYLKGRGINNLLLCGLAFDYCVYFTALDGIGKGYKVIVLTDLTQPVGSPEGSIDRARQDMENRGVQFAKSDLLRGVVKE